MNDRGSELIPVSGNQEKNKKPSWLKTKVSAIKDKYQQKKERKKILSANEKAKAELENIGLKLHHLVETPSWKSIEKKTTTTLPDGTNLDNHTLKLSGTDEMTGLTHHVSVTRSSFDKKPLEIHDTITPETGGPFLGSWEVGMGFITNESFGDGSFQGAFFIGKEAGEGDHIRISKEDIVFDIGKMDFGEWRGSTTLIVSAARWSEDPDTGDKISPLGPIQEIRFLNLGRQKIVTDAKNPFDADHFSIKVGDGFTSWESAQELPGKLPTVIKVEKTDSGYIISSSGEGRPLPTQGNSNPKTRIETKKFVIPFDFGDARKVIPQLAGAVDQLEKASTNKFLALPQPSF